MNLLLLFLTLLGQNPSEEGPGLVLIVNPDVQSNVEVADIQRIYLNRKKKWSSGNGIIFATLADGPVHRIFLEHFVGKSSAQFSTYWKRVIFTGKGTPPKTFQTEKELVYFVAHTPGAIGYVSLAAKLDGVRVLNLD